MLPIVVTFKIYQSEKPGMYVNFIPNSILLSGKIDIRKKKIIFVC